jgi:hypothetical protein
MRLVGINSFGLKIPLRLLLAFIIIGSSTLLVIGQTGTKIQRARPRIAASSVTPSTIPANIDEAFELNINERRYSQENFEAATAVGTTQGTDRLDLQIGVALTSGRIDVLLRNVHGRVRFRGTLDRIFEVINNRQAPAPNSLPTTAPTPSP